MMIARSVRLLALIAVFTAAACSEDDGVTPGDLSEAEAQALAGVILTQAFTSTASISTSPAQAAGGPARVPVTFTRSVQTTVSCPLGGDVGVDATFDYAGDTDTEAAQVDFTITQVHNGCVVSANNGTRFTLDGSPDLELTITIMSDADGADWDGGIGGSIDWLTSDREGTCQIGLEFGGSVESQTVSFTMAGNVCGTSVDQTLNIG